MRVTNDIPLGCPLFLPVHTVNYVQTLKDISDEMRLSAAENHVTTLEAAYTKAMLQLKLAEDAAVLSQKFPDAMAAMAAERSAEEVTGRTVLSSKSIDEQRQYMASYAAFDIEGEQWANSGALPPQSLTTVQRPAGSNITGHAGAHPNGAGDWDNASEGTDYDDAPDMWANADSSMQQQQQQQQQRSHTTNTAYTTVYTGRTPSPKLHTSRPSTPSGLAQSAGGWESDSHFGFDSDDSDEEGRGGRNTHFAKVQKAWQFRGDQNTNMSPERETVRCAFFDSNLHPRMPLSYTPLLHMRRCHACDL
jgi:hypothetical protein